MVIDKQLRTSNLHWICKYLGIPYAPGGRNRQGVDCWGLVRLVYAEQFGIELPEIPGIRTGQTFADIVEQEKDAWTEISKPIDGCGVAMSKKTILHHVGVWATADGGKIIHCLKPQSVEAIPISRLWPKGFLVVKFYRHNLWPT